MPGAWAQLGAAASVRGAVTMPTSPANRGRTPGSCTKPPTTVDSPVISVPTGIPAATAANTHTRSALRRLLENRKSEAASAVSALRAQEHLEISRPMATVQLNELQCKLEALVNELRDNYVPGHGPRQFICPSVFLKSELFRADASAGPRENIDCQLHTGTADPVRYVGPELRQDDALVFMAMVHMGRDFPPATTLTFSATEMCLCLFGGYDGSRRRRLADCIKRLMRGVLTIGNSLSVQLVGEFCHPSAGRWSVSLHPSVIALYKASQHVWLEQPVLLRLNPGLETWMYGFIRAHPSGIDMGIDDLRKRSGCEDSSDATFIRRLRRALDKLIEHDVAPGRQYRITSGVLIWRRAGVIRRAPKAISAQSWRFALAFLSALCLPSNTFHVEFVRNAGLSVTHVVASPCLSMLFLPLSSTYISVCDSGSGSPPSARRAASSPSAFCGLWGAGETPCISCRAVAGP